MATPDTPPLAGKPHRNVLAVIALLIVLPGGCASVPERDRPPPESDRLAEVPGIPEARYWADVPPDYALQQEWWDTPREVLKAEHPALFGTEHSYLAISGGGQNGAFGAGLLTGWTDTGTRPEFSIVTGISTGALMAPFAFLGPDYDPQLREVYTTTSTEDIANRRGRLAALRSDALSGTEPLQALIAKYVDEDLVDAIAKEQARGRDLFIGTTNIDAGRPVIWDITEIAASGAPDRVELIRKVLLASASIPVAFPPVVFDVEIDGEPYEELHVDGGAASQVFLYPTGLNWRKINEKLEVRGIPRAYVLRNARLEPQWKTVERKLGTIGGRTISMLIRTQGIGDMYRIYLFSQFDGIDYNLAYIPNDFTMEPEESFDPEYMKALFDAGYRLAQSDKPWRKYPPGIEEVERLFREEMNQ